MGRSRKVVDISTGKIGKQARIERKMQEEQLRRNSTPLGDDVPAWLSDSASVEYKRIVDDAKKAGVLDSLDMAAIAIYADSYARYVEASQCVQEEGLIVGKGCTNPYLKVMRDASDTIMRCSTKLGLFATDRLKLIVPKVEERKQNKFLKHL